MAPPHVAELKANEVALMEPDITRAIAPPSLAEFDVKTQLTTESVLALIAPPIPDPKFAELPIKVEAVISPEWA